MQSSRDAIRKVIETAVQQNISYGDILSKTDEKTAKIFVGTQSRAAKADPIYEMPDYERLAKELKRPRVTMEVLREEYSYNCR